MYRPRQQDASERQRRMAERAVGLLSRTARLRSSVLTYSSRSYSKPEPSGQLSVQPQPTKVGSRGVQCQQIELPVTSVRPTGCSYCCADLFVTGGQVAICRYCGHEAHLDLSSRTPFR